MASKAPRTPNRITIDISSDDEAVLPGTHPSVAICIDDDSPPPTKRARTSRADYKSFTAGSGDCGGGSSDDELLRAATSRVESQMASQRALMRSWVDDGIQMAIREMAGEATGVEGQVLRKTIACLLEHELIVLALSQQSMKRSLTASQPITHTTHTTCWLPRLRDPQAPGRCTGSLPRLLHLSLLQLGTAMRMSLRNRSRGKGVRLAQVPARKHQVACKGNSILLYHIRLPLPLGILFSLITLDWSARGAGKRQATATAAKNRKIAQTRDSPWNECATRFDHDERDSEILCNGRLALEWGRPRRAHLMPLVRRR